MKMRVGSHSQKLFGVRTVNIEMKTGEGYLLDGCRAWTCELVTTGIAEAQREVNKMKLIDVDVIPDIEFSVCDATSATVLVRTQMSLATIPSADRRRLMRGATHGTERTNRPNL